MTHGDQIVPAQATASASESGLRRVLFVDDEPRVLDGLRRMLRCHRDAWDMRFVHSGEAALEALRLEPADVVITDYRMPGMDGGQLLKAIRERHPRTARLVLSGHTEDADLTSVVSLAHQFLTKPCDPDELYRAVDRALRAGDDLSGAISQAAVASVDLLPSPSVIVLRLMATIDSPGSGARAIAAIIQGDVALSAKLLQVVNSSFFAPRARVTSLEAAVARLGLRTLRSLVCMEQMARVLELPSALSTRWLPALNRQAELTAGLARQLAVPAAADDAFCAALLHECGQLVFAAGQPDTFTAFLHAGADTVIPLPVRELDTFGMTHEQAGVALLNLWGFPPEIVGASLSHSAPVDSLQRDDVGSLVRFAHHIVEHECVRVCAPPHTQIADELLDREDIKRVLMAWRTGEAVAC